MKKKGAISLESVGVLESQGCVARDWSEVFVHPETDFSLIHNVFFSGPVVLGALRKKCRLTFPDMETRTPGLYSLKLDRVILGDDVRLEEIGETVRHVKVGDRSLILRVEEISCDRRSSFGCDVPLSVLNENGRRPCHLRSDLSAQWAHLEVFHKQDRLLQKKIALSSRAMAKTLTGDNSLIGHDVMIRGCGRLRNLQVGDRARVIGASLLEDGTLAPDSVVDGPVTARHFVLGRKARLDGATHVERAFLGEGTEVGKGAIITDTVLFADSQFHGGEAVSAWCGVHTVSHHKSTLLIAGAWHFYNAGSGANFSNHHYRLGPVHQGLLDRGCKSGSSSFLLFPSHIGAFSTLIGRHGRTLDSADFPFSLLVGKGDRTRLYPGFLCFSAGQYRDEKKWPVRDQRPDHPQDLFVVKRLSPFTIDRALRGMGLLQPLLDVPVGARDSVETVDLRGMEIPRSQLASSIKAYQLLVRGWAYLNLLDHYDRKPWHQKGHPFKNPLSPQVREPWVDWAGVLCPQRLMVRAAAQIRTGQISKPGELRDQVQKICDQLPLLEWQWIVRHASHLIPRECLESPKRLAADLPETLDAWYGRFAEDGKKEFAISQQVGYGMDGDKEFDFLAVRGKASEDQTLRTLESERVQNLARAKKLASVLHHF